LDIIAFLFMLRILFL